MDDKNKNVITEDKCLEINQLETVNGGLGLHDAETNQTTEISDNTKDKI